MNWISRLKSSFEAKSRKSGSTTVDVASINYTMPTVAADCLTFVTPTEASFEGAPCFHEDEWCQIEFLPKAGLGALQATLTKFKAFERSHRVQHGWSEVFARGIPRTVLLEGADAVERVAGLFGTNPINAPILSTTSSPLGQVEMGFAVRPSTDVLLYGLADERGITALGALLDGDDMQLSQTFAVLHSPEKLVLVDWRGQLVLCDVGTDGRFAAWRP